MARVITQHCMQILLISDYKSLYLSYYKLVIAREYCTVYSVPVHCTVGQQTISNRVKDFFVIQL